MTEKEEESLFIATRIESMFEQYTLNTFESMKIIARGNKKERERALDELKNESGFLHYAIQYLKRQINE